MEEDFIEEISFQDSLIPISSKRIKEISFQMDNCICKIIKPDAKKGTGFFCKIKLECFPEPIPFLVTNYHVINRNDFLINDIICITYNDDKELRKIKIDNNRKIYTNKILDITFIELKKDDKISNFLEIDENIIKEEEDIIEIKHKKDSIYTLHYPRGDNVEVSYGLTLDIIKENIRHKCNTETGSSGAPILSLKTFKVIGIHRGGVERNNTDCVRYNKGTFIKYAIKKLNEYYSNNKIITIISKAIYDPIIIFGQKFVENNKDNCKIKINSNEYQLSKSYESLQKEWIFNKKTNNFELTLILVEINKIIDFSYMFSFINYDTLFS